MATSKKHTKKSKRHTKRACSCRRTNPIRRNTRLIRDNSAQLYLGPTMNRKDLHKIMRKTKRHRTSRKNMRGGFVACNDKIITEPGFNVPVFGKAPGLSIPDTKVPFGSSDTVKVDHPMVQ